MAEKPPALAEPAREWIADRVASGAWPDAEAYPNDLVARDREAAECRAALDAALDEGDASGYVEMSIEEVFEEARARNLHAGA